MVVGVCATFSHCVPTRRTWAVVVVDVIFWAAKLTEPWSSLSRGPFSSMKLEANSTGCPYMGYVHWSFMT